MAQENPLRVLFIACRHDPHDHHAGSGMDYDLYQGLLRNGAEVKIAGPFPYFETLPERAFRKVHSYLFKLRPSKYAPAYLKNAANAARQTIQAYRPDVIFSKHAAILCRVKTDIPIVTLADTTLLGSQTEWPIFTHAAFEQQNSWERKTYGMAKHIILYSQWSADMLVEHYHQDRNKIHVLPIPASIPESAVPEEINIHPLAPLKILLVGREYRRKGIDIAIDVVKRLNAEGIPAHLRIVGTSGDSGDNIEFMGLYKKTIPEQLEGYAANYRWANFLIHPARFEAAGIVPSEAAAFGVPTVTNAAGGLATTVADGISGIVLPKHSPAEAYVQVFKRFMNDPQAYRQLCESTRKRYETELNWNVAAKRIYQIIRSAAG